VYSTSACGTAKRAPLPGISCSSAACTAASSARPDHPGRLPAPAAAARHRTRGLRPPPSRAFFGCRRRAAPLGAGLRRARCAEARSCRRPGVRSLARAPRLVQVAHELANEDRVPAVSRWMACARRWPSSSSSWPVILPRSSVTSCSFRPARSRRVTLSSREILARRAWRSCASPSSVARYVPTPTMSVNITVTVPIWALSRAIP
jgi:hypothetical protein